MTWTYTAQPDTDPQDEIHFLCGDTDPLDPLLQDQEIDMLLAMYPKSTDPVRPAYLAAAAGCDAIASRFGRKMQQTIGPLSKSAQMQFEHYITLAQQYRTAFATDGEGTVASPLRVVAAGPVLGGGGPTYLGSNRLLTGGAGPGY